MDGRVRTRAGLSIAVVALLGGSLTATATGSSASLGHRASAQAVPGALAAQAAAARPPAAMVVSAGNRLRVNVNPNLPGKAAWKVRVLKAQGGTWRRICTCRTKGRAEKLSLKLAKGTYRLELVHRKGYRTSDARTTIGYDPSPKASPPRVGRARGFPNASSTGVPRGTALKPYQGPCTIRRANTVIDARRVTCDLVIQAPGVRVSRSRITGSVTNGRPPSPDITPSFTVSDSEVIIGDRAWTGIEDSNFTVIRVHVRGGKRSINCSANCTIIDSYVHGQYTDNTGLTHESGIRMGENTVIRHNTIACDAPDVPPDGGCSGALTGYGDFGPVRNNTIEGNLIKATTGGFCAYGGSVEGKPYPHARNIVYRNNTFEKGRTGRCGTWGPITSFDDTAPGNIWTGNVWTDGTTVKPSN